MGLWSEVPRRDLGVAFQAPPGSQASSRGEAKDSALLSSRDAHYSSKASILLCSAFFTVQLSQPYMTTGKTIALTRRTFVGKVMSLLLNMLSRLVITFLPRSKHLLLSWLQSPSAVILQPWALSLPDKELCLREALAVCTPPAPEPSAERPGS